MNPFLTPVFPPLTGGAMVPTPLAPDWQAATARTLHLINGEHYSGAERVQDLLAQRLPELGYEVGLACLKPGRFPQLRQAREAPLYTVAMRSRVDFTAVRAIREIVHRDRYDLLHAHTPRAVMLGSLVARWTGLPLVYHVHSPVGRDSRRWLQNWLNGRIERFSLQQLSRMITVSSSLADYMRQQGYDDQLISVVPNGVPVTNRRRSESPPTGTWTLGTVALFRPRKGTEVLLDAMARLREQGCCVRLRAVGGFESAAYEQKLRRLAARAHLVDAIDWTGFTRDVNAELTQMDLFVLPSLYGEGLPMVVLESMAAGLPVVGTRVEGVPEALRDGTDGVLADPANFEDLARAIRKVMEGQLNWSQLRTSALRRHSELFSDHAMARGVADAYEQVLFVPPTGVHPKFQVSNPKQIKNPNERK